MRTEQRERKVRPIADVTSPALRKWQYTCRLFQTNGRKKGALWRIDLFLGSDHETNNKTSAARQQILISMNRWSLLGNDSINTFPW
jgi:hypothetical protein